MFPKSKLPVGHPYRDFRNFLKDVWDFLGLPEPDPLQYDMAWWLQYGPNRSISEAFRGFGKSYVTSAFACWCWLNDPDFKILVVSGGKDRADDFTRFCLMLLRGMPELQHLSPRRDQLSSLTKFNVNGSVPSHSPSCRSVGITGQLTGGRADLIIPDDVETPKNSRTVTEREKLETLVTEFDAVLKPEDHCKITYLGTPQNEDSLYNKLQSKGYVARVWPARKPKPSKVVDKYGDALSPLIADLDVAPGTALVDRFDEKQLLDRAASYGATGFALQFMLDTSLEDELRFPLKARDLVVMDLDRSIAPVAVTWASDSERVIDELQCVGLKGDRFHSPMYTSDDHTEYDGKMMYVDPSGRGKDRTGYAVVNHLKGKLYVRRWGSLEGGYEDDTLETLAHIARAEQVNQIMVESNFGDGMYLKLFKPVLERVYPVDIDEESVHTRKEDRIIDTLEPLMNQHRLVVDKQIIINDLKEPQEHSVFFQMTRITRQKDALSHDDGLDALTGACGYWAEYLRESIDNIEEDHKSEQFDAMLDEYMEHAGGSTRPDMNWRPDRMAGG